MRLFLFVLSILSSSCFLTAQEKNLGTLPRFDFTLKTKYEYIPESNIGRFSVRNSRVGLSGGISPDVSYRVQLELSNTGKFEVLDLYGNVKLFKGFDLTIGQSSIPVFNTYQITPAQMLFANRTFLGKFLSGSRDIGLLANYQFGICKTPVALQFGVFNGSTINNPVWTNRPSYSARLLVGNMCGLRATAKIYRYPLASETDYMICGADLRYGGEKFKIESEVMNRHNYFNGVDRFTSCLQGAYSFTLKEGGLVKNIIPALRWDGIGENIRESGFDVNRLTVGISLGLTSKPFTSLIRFDYEWYFVKNPIQELSLYDEICSNKFTMELLIQL